LADRRTQQPGSFRTPQRIDKMILFVCVKLNQIYSQGRHFQWRKPDRCPRCQSARLWGHGRVMAYFNGFSQGLLLRRFRCPDCGCIIRLKPCGYFNRFQATIGTIRSCLQRRLSGGKWPKGQEASRQRHWLSALKRKSLAFFGAGVDLMAAFDRLMEKAVIPVSRAI
jgi:hypothetical protein